MLWFDEKSLSNILTIKKIFCQLWFPMLNEILTPINHSCSLFIFHWIRRRDWVVFDSVFDGVFTMINLQCISLIIFLIINYTAALPYFTMEIPNLIDVVIFHSRLIQIQKLSDFQKLLVHLWDIPHFNIFFQILTKE